MKKFIRLASPLIVTILFLVVSSAYASQLEIDDQTLPIIDEHSINGTSAGQVAATGSSLTYSITDGNTNGAFEINSHSGEIIVANSDVLDYETIPGSEPKAFNLTVVIEDKKSKTDSAIVTIPINDIDEVPSLTGLIETLEIDANAGPQIIDPDVTLTCAGNPIFDNWELEIELTNWVLGVDLVEFAVLSNFSYEGQDITYGSTVIGSFTYADYIYHIVFNSDATCQVLEELIESLTYQNTSDNPASSRQMTIVFSNLSGSSDPVTITITLLVTNTAPVAVDDAYTMYQGGTISISAANGVLSNDNDPDPGDSITATLKGSPPIQAGSFSLKPDGGFVYAHDGSTTGTVSFQYEVCDDGNPEKCTNGTVTITILETTVPVLSTPTATNVTKTSASLGATVNDNGGAEVTERGVVWSITENPTVESCSGSKTATGTGSTFSVPVTALASNTIYHYRGYAKNEKGYGYTADTTFTTNAEYDFGDAPSPYPTKIVNDGARHAVSSGIYLGNSIDGENDGQPSSDANGDGIDEDGVTFSSQVLNAGATVYASVKASVSGILNVWIDFNCDGDWEDDYEHTIDDFVLIADINSVGIVAPPNAVSGQTYVRFRFSSTSGLDPTGLAPDGEVEDYQLTLEGSADSGNGGAVLSSVSVSSANINEGTELTLTGNVTDSGGLEIDWGDGANPETSSLNSSGNWSRKHKYPDAPADPVTYTIGIEFTDSSGAVHTDSKQVTVKNVKPSISLTSSPTSVNKGESYTLTLGQVTDRGQDTVSDYTIDWGDGSNLEPYTYVTGDSRSHTYTSVGVYTVHVDLTDEDGTHPDAGTHSVSVNDPAAGTGNTNESNTDDNDGTADSEEGTDDSSGTDDTGNKTSSSKRSSSGGVSGSGFGGSGLSSRSSSDSEDSGGGGVPIWLIVVPIVGVLVVGVGGYYFLGSYMEWW